MFQKKEMLLILITPKSIGKKKCELAYWEPSVPKSRALHATVDWLVFMPLTEIVSQPL
jgi:hypothetical protein